jgi:hypothetical protein
MAEMTLVILALFCNRTEVAFGPELVTPRTIWTSSGIALAIPTPGTDIVDGVLLFVVTVLIVSACEALETVAEYATTPRKATARIATTRDIPTILPDIVLLLIAWIDKRRLI